MGLEDPYKNPRLFGMFLLFSTTIPNLLSIPCFYYSGLDYVEHKKKEEAVIEAAESFKDQDEKNIKSELICKIFDNEIKKEGLAGMKRVSSSVKLTSCNKDIEAL